VNETTEPELCGSPYNTTGDDTCEGCCGGVAFTCDQGKGHIGAHFADVHGRNADEPRIAQLRWRT
jgi:hypothetical protein